MSLTPKQKRIIYAIYLLCVIPLLSLPLLTVIILILAGFRELTTVAYLLTGLLPILQLMIGIVVFWLCIISNRPQLINSNV